MFRWNDTYSSIKIRFNEDSSSFSVSYESRRKKPLRLVVMLGFRESRPGGFVEYRPVLLTSPTEKGTFHLSTFPVFPKIQLTNPESTSEDNKWTLKCMLAGFFTKETEMSRFSFDKAGAPIDIVELTGRNVTGKLKIAWLYKQAVDFQARRPSLNNSRYLYRNKPPKYFNDILRYHQGVMYPYVKDENGDPDNPINGALEGLFFMSNVDNRTKLPPTSSPFGSTRLLIPIDYMLRSMVGNCNIYFADFYCLENSRHNAHYVTLVFTEDGSTADMFCRENLPPLQSDNPFFKIYNYCFWVSQIIWVEIFYTKEIDIVRACRHGGAEIHESFSSGTSKPNGIPKNPNCRQCNLCGFEEWKIT